MAQVQLVYTVEAGLRRVADMVTDLLAIDVFDGELDILEMTVNSDTAVAVGTTAQRTILLDVSAAGELLYPTDAAKISATLHLYGMSISLRLPAIVQDAVPVVIP